MCRAFGTLQAFPRRHCAPSPPTGGPSHRERALGRVHAGNRRGDHSATSRSSVKNFAPESRNVHELSVITASMIDAEPEQRQLFAEEPEPTSVAAKGGPPRTSSGSQPWTAGGPHGGIRRAAPEQVPVSSAASSSSVPTTSQEVMLKSRSSLSSLDPTGSGLVGSGWGPVERDGRIGCVPPNQVDYLLEEFNLIV